jgi:uncharacterized membrane protein SpoIIM required for sporulation
MNLETFLSEREPAWQRLEQELTQSRGRPERLGLAGALDLGRGYRAVVADLAMARRRFPGDPVIDRLERLALAGRQAIYARRARSMGSLWRFVSRDYWRLIAGRPGPLAAAVLAMMVPCAIAAVWALHDPAAALGLVPARFRAASHPHVHSIAVGAATQAALASSIFTNNIRVTFLAFAGGLTLGLGTLALLAYNGVLLGTLAGITLQSGNFAVFLRYVVPHGVLELSCISVAGAAGLRLASAVIEPGTLSRGVSLRAAARPAVALAVGTAPWLVLAGLTEGFVTPRGLPLSAALAVGLFLGGLFWLLVTTRGRRRGADLADARDHQADGSTLPAHTRASALALR